MPTSPIPVTPLAPTSAATVVWRARGALHLTVVVKATFALVPERRMTVVDPDPIATSEHPHPSGVGLRTAGDCAPYLGHAEVWLTGHAETARQASNPSVRVQLSVVQAGAVRVDKLLDLSAPPSAREGAAIAIAGMGPIAKDWPLRKRWLEGIDPRVLDRPVMEVPDTLHWEYFQTAPRDQRLDALRGDEWIVLGGMVLRRPRLRTQLPEARGAARLYRRLRSEPRAGDVIPLHADTLQIDVDRQRCSILWRGRIELKGLKGTEELGTLHVVTGLEEPGKDVAWSDPFQTDLSARFVPGVNDPVSDVFAGGTLGLPNDLSARLGAMPAIPFQPPPGSERNPWLMNRPSEPPLPPPSVPSPPSSRSSNAAAAFSGGATVPLSDDLQKELAALRSTPFEDKPAASSVDDGPFGGTMALSDNVQRRLAAAIALPFDTDAPVPNAEEVFSGTMALSPAATRKLAEAPSTPFEARAPEARAAFGSVPSFEGPTVGRPAMTSEVDFGSRPSAPPPSSAPRATTSSAMVIAIPDDDEGLKPGGLGAAFLAAMRRHASQHAQA